jgi:O-antigen/teichoic acid export membrane protein
LSAVGFWALGWRLLQAVILVLDALWRVLFPALARLLEHGEDVGPVLERSMARVAVMAGFVLVVLGGTAPALVPVLFGPGWDEGARLLPWASLGLMLAGPIEVCTIGYLYATNRAPTVLRTTLTYTAVWFAATAALLPSLGAEAVGIGMAVGATVNFCVLTAVLRRHVSTSPPRAVFPALAIAAAASVAAWWVAREVEPDVLALVLGIVIAEGLYLAGVLVFRRAVLADLARLVRGAAQRASSSA